MNSVFLITCLGLVKGLKLTAQDIGLKVNRTLLGEHGITCLSIFLLYMTYYLLVVRISGLRPVTSQTWWGILNYLIVAFAEEIYFRGILYSVVQTIASEKIALVTSTLLFGLAHAQQGLAMILKFFTGWLWGSVRYSTGMIFLLIIPIHLAYNLVWLLFLGNWDHPPLWSQFLPLVELLMGVIIVIVHDRIHGKHGNE